ncbi:hypothetical protein LTS09_016779 [Friedmanniomyces endolithicus]|nr:hypothetical protein LTS09_016779 [Friedmanniomyces endolithicus]
MALLLLHLPQKARATVSDGNSNPVQLMTTSPHREHQQRTQPAREHLPKPSRCTPVPPARKAEVPKLGLTTTKTTTARLSTASHITLVVSEPEYMSHTLGSIHLRTFVHALHENVDLRPALIGPDTTYGN